MESDTRLWGKIVSLFLMSSVLLLAYVATVNLGQPVSMPGKVSIDPAVQFKQNDNVSYWFASDSYVDRLEIAPSYFEINSLTMTTSVSTGNVNVMLYDTDPSDSYLKWTATQDVPTAQVSFDVSGLQAGLMYDWFVDGRIVARTVASAGSDCSYTYGGPWTSHTFVLQRGTATLSGLQASFEYAIDGNTITFTDKSIGPITEWIWNFGDKDGSTKQSPVHQYSATGKYAVSLTVYDSSGDHSTASVQINLQLGPNYPVERTPTGWDVYVSDKLTLSISAVGLLIAGAIMYVSAIYLRYFPIITPAGRKVIGAIMVIAGLYFLVIVDNSWMHF